MDKVLYINKIDPVSFRTKDLKIRFFFEIFRSDDGLFLCTLYTLTVELKPLVNWAGASRPLTKLEDAPDACPFA